MADLRAAALAEAETAVRCTASLSNVGEYGYGGEIFDHYILDNPDEVAAEAFAAAFSSRDVRYELAALLACNVCHIEWDEAIRIAGVIAWGFGHGGD